MSLKTTLKKLIGSAVLAMERLPRGRRVATPPDEVRSVLVLEYRLPLGCCVHLTPLFEAIKRSRPEVTLTVATLGLGLAVQRHNPFIDCLIETADPLTDLAAAARSLSRQLKQNGIEPDCVLTSVDDRRTRIALLGLIAGQGWRGGFTLVPELYQRPLDIDPTLSHIDNNLRLAAFAGCSTAHREPRVFFSAADVARVESMVKNANPQQKPLVVFVTQNSGGQRTGWHTNRFVQVVRHAHDVLGCSVVYVGTQGDVTAIEALRAEAGGIGTSFAGRTSVTELAALLAMSDYVVSLDTGTMHIGRAVGVPLVVIGPSWQKPLEWLPLGIPNARILRGEDRLDVPPDYQLDEVQADQVIEALEELAAAYPASEAGRSERLDRSLSMIDHLKQ